MPSVLSHSPVLLVGLDPVAAPGVARVLDEAAADLEARAARIRALLDQAGAGDGVPASVRLVAAGLRADAADLRRRAEELVRDAQRLFGELAAFVGADVLNAWNGGPDASMPWGRWLAGASRAVRGSVFVGKALTGRGPNPVPLFNNGIVGRGLQLAPGFRWVGSPGVTTALRGLGIAGGVTTGVVGTVDLVRQGNPVEAFRRDGAGYVADVAGAAFGYSSAAFLVAPNPVTGAVMVGTGVVWLGAEAWDKREDIVDAWNGAREWTGERLSGIGGAAGDVVGGAVRSVAGVADAVSFWD